MSGKSSTTPEKIGASAGNRGRGRKKGVPNKLTQTIKAAIETAFSQAGGADYLTRMAEEQPVAFMALLAKVLPTQITGDNGGAIVTEIRIVGVEP
jgi:hypothetical protein